MNKGQTNRLLGYPVDARLLIINADDFGMCHAINEAIFRALKKGVLRSATLADIFDVMLRLAREYGLALRVAGRSWIEKVQSQGLPTNDYDFLDSYLLGVVDKSARYDQLLHELPAGLSEWAVHPGLDNSELLAIEPDGKHVRQTDFDFLMSQEAKDIVNEEGIILLDYRALQVVWRGK